MKKTKKVLASLAIASMVMTTVPFNAFADTGITTARLSGSDRVGTAVAVADAGWTTATTAILAPAADANLVDALAAAPLAGKNAPILLTDNNTLTAATKAELVKLGVKNVYVVGAISQTVVDQVNAMSGVTATVLKGADRIGTATAISAKLSAPAGSFVVGYGALADALSVASYAAANNYSILVANPDGSLPVSEAAYKGSNVYIIGGPTLVKDIAGATRLYGADRFATNKAVLNALTYKYNNVYVANGLDAHLVDSLVASSLAAESGAPIVLGDTTSAAAASDVHAKLATNAVVTALGGSTVVPPAVVNQVVTGTTTTTTPTTTSDVKIANLSVTGQTVGTGALNAPAVAAINNGVTVSTTVTGASAANANMTYLVSTSDNITATANGKTLSSTTLSTPVIIGNNTYNATYSVPADANGNVSATFVSTASSNQAFNVVVQAPFYNNSQVIQSNQACIQWGVPGTLVLSPLYTSNTPDNLNFSSSSTQNGLVPVVATYLPVSGSTTSVSGQAVKFTMIAQSVSGNATTFFTDSTGTTSIGQNSSVGGNTGTSISVPTAYYNVTTDSSGQALVYVNANQPTTNSVANMGASIKVSVKAELVNGGGATNMGYYKWQSVAQATQVANLSPSQMLNTTGLSSTTDTVVSDAAEKATSGSQITISGTIQDAAGNPVPNVNIAVQDYDVMGGATSNNIQNDAYVLNGTTTLFSATNYPIVTTDSSGNFSYVVTANVPVTQSVYNSQTKYYMYYVPPTVSLASGSSLPTTGLTNLSFVGNSNKSTSSNGNYVNLVWQQGQTVQAVAVSADPLQSQYSGISAVPTSSQNFSNVLGDDEEVYIAAFNQNGQMVAPTLASTSGNQFAGYGFDYSLSLPSNITIEKFGNGTDLLPWKDSSGNDLATPTTVELQYYNGSLHLVNWTGTILSNNTLGTAGSTYSSGTINQVLSDTAAYDGSGQLILYLNSVGTTATSGSVSATISAYSGIAVGAGSLSTDTAQGAGSASISANFTAASTLSTLGVEGTASQLSGYLPLLNGNAAPPSTTTVAGTAKDAADMSSNAEFVVAPFNNEVAMATIPTQGLTYTLTSTLNGKIRYIDGYQLQSAPQTAQVNVQSNGMVSVNNAAIWPSVTGTVLGYANDGTTNYILAQSGSVITLYSVGTIGTSAATTATQISQYTIPSGTVLKQTYEGYLGFSTSGTSLTVQAGITSGNSTGQTPLTGGTAPTLDFAPVQAVTAYVGDKYAESPVVTVTNSVNSQKATITSTFTSQSGGIASATSNPTSVNFSLGSNESLTITAVDTYGNALPNQTIYLQGSSVTGLWLTQVNGSAIQQSINLGTSNNPSFQTTDTPVPLFVYSASGSNDAGYTPAYGSVYVTGALSANNLNNGSTPYVALTTGVDGTVTFTLQDGNVQYQYKNGDQSANTYVDSGKIISGTLTFTNLVPGSTGIKTLGTIKVNVN